MSKTLYEKKRDKTRKHKKEIKIERDKKVEESKTERKGIANQNKYDIRDEYIFNGCLSPVTPSKVGLQDIHGTYIRWYLRACNAHMTGKKSVLQLFSI